MATQLKIDIVLDDNGAAKTLADVDSGLKKVGATAELTASQLEAVRKQVQAGIDPKKIVIPLEDAVTAAKGLGPAVQQSTQQAVNGFAAFRSQINQHNAEVLKAAEAPKAWGASWGQNIGTYTSALAAAQGPTRTFMSGLGELGTNLKSVGAGVKDALSMLGPMGSMLAGLSIAAVVKDAIAFTSHLQDMSAKTGASTSDLQKLGLAGSLVGVSMDQITSAISQMQNRLVAENPQAVEAVGKLGLTVAGLLDMDPGTAMNTLADAMGRLPDPAERTRIAMELFGKSGAALLPMLNGELQKVGDSMEAFGLIISKNAIEGGDALDDLATIAEASFKRMVIAKLGLGRLGFDLQQVRSISTFLGGDNTPTTPGAPSMFATGNGGPVAPDKISAKEALSIEKELTNEYKQQLEERKRAAEAWQKVNDDISGKSAISSAQTWMKHLTQVGGVTKLTDDATKNLTQTLNEAIEAYGRLGGTAGKATTEMLKVWAGLQKANMVAPGIVQDISQDSLDSMAMQDWAKAQVAPTIGRLGMPNDTGPQLMLPDLPGIVEEMSLATLTINQEAIQNAPMAVSPFRQAFTQLGKDLPGMIFGSLQGGGSILGTLASGLGAIFGNQFQEALKKAGGDLSKVSGGNKALGIAGASVGAAFTGYDLGTKLGKGKGALAGAAAGALAGSVVPGIGTAIGAGVGAIAGWFGGRKKDKQEKADMEAQRADMVEQFGGMAKLQALAKSLDVDLTKAFSTKKPAEFRTEVEKLNAAMDARAKSPQGMAEAQYKTVADQQAEAQQAVDIWQYMANSGKYSADTVKQAWEAANTALIASGDKQALAAQAANQAISELDSKISGLQASFANEAPEEAMGVIETQARAQVAALEEQRAAAKANIDSIKGELQPLIDGGVKIPIDFYVRSGMPGMPASNDGFNPNASAGDVSSSGFANNAGNVITDGNGNVVAVLGGNADDGRQYHSGGIIRRMHSGGLAGDEVPIIAQTGEFMVSRRGVAAAGMRQLQRINRGESGGGGTSTIIVEIDGRTVTETTLPHWIGAVQRLGLGG